MSNNHYIPRFLTKPWELTDRYLRYYDFADAQIKTKSSKSLFSENDVYSDEVEAFFQKKVETPFSQFRAKFLNEPHPEKTVSIRKWKTYRACVLLILHQAARYSIAMDREGEPSTLGKDLLKDDSFLDGVVTTVDSENRLVTLSLSGTHRLFFPETGFFAIPTQDAGCATGWTWAFAVPIHPRHVVALVSKSVEDAELERLQMLNGYLTARSVGTGPKTNRLIIPPEIDVTDSQNLSAVLTKWRTASAEENRNVEAIRSLTTDMYTRAGLQLTRVPANTGKRQLPVF